MSSVAGEMRSEISRVLYHESTIMSRIDELASSIAIDYTGKDFTVVAVLNGSLMFGADLLRRLEMPLRLDPSKLRLSVCHKSVDKTPLSLDLPKLRLSLCLS